MSTNNLSVELGATRRPKAGFAERARMFVLLPSIVGAILSMALFFARVREGLRTLGFPDEVEQLVAGQMLNHGRHLYRDVFSHHGPLPYMIAQLYASLVSESDFSYIRIFQVILAMGSCMAVVLCPALKIIPARIWAGALYLLLLALVWIPDGMALFLYPWMSGFLLVIVIAQGVVPSMFSERPSKSGLITSGAAGALACFCGYSSGPAALLFALSLFASHALPSSSRRVAVDASLFALGAGLATLAVGTWLYVFGDIKGFYVYHFYFNQHVYVKYIDYSVLDLLKNFALSFTPQTIIGSVGVFSFICWLYIFAALKPKSASAKTFLAWAFSLVFLASGVVFANARGGSGLGDSGFLTSNLALFSIAISLVLERNLLGGSKWGIVYSISASMMVALLVSQIGGYAVSFLGIPQKEASSYVETIKPDKSAIYEFVRTITRKDGDLLVLNYNATLYLKADRLPASGNLFYLPWQAEYNKSPKYGYKIDICSDIRMRRPAVIWFFNWRVWEKYSIDDYEPCVISLIVAGYTPLSFDSPWHIRNDLFKTSITKLPLGAVTAVDWGPALKEKIMRLSAQLSLVAPIEIVMAPGYETRKMALRRLGIMLATRGRRNTGEAELHLRGTDGSEFSQRFALSAVEDNRYQYFDIDSKWYASAEIRSDTGEGISTWESDFPDSSSYTCVIYEYIDGTRGYTPACPVM